LIDGLRTEIAALQRTYGLNDQQKLSESQQPTGHRTGAQGAQKWVLKFEDNPQKLTSKLPDKELIPVYKLSEESDCHARTQSSQHTVNVYKNFVDQDGCVKFDKQPIFQDQPQNGFPPKETGF